MDKSLYAAASFDQQTSRLLSVGRLQFRLSHFNKLNKLSLNSNLDL